jgi:predicted pyridoxine 5'-phosphate oxidase superfamily flavin-nucleotide-binding protein
MSMIYTDSSRVLQDKFDTRRLADRLAEVKVRDRFTSEDRQFVERLDMFFLATVDGTGQPTCSYKGGDPGFITILDEQTLAFPNYDGNGMYLSMGNLAATQGIGMLLIDFELQRRMRIDGVAQIAMSDPLLERYPEAQFMVRVEAKRIYPNCQRYIHKYQLVERSAFVPRDSQPTPIPGWKQTPWAKDVLPARDPARSE